MLKILNQKKLDSPSLNLKKQININSQLPLIERIRISLQTIIQQNQLIKYIQLKSMVNQYQLIVIHFQAKLFSTYSAMKKSINKNMHSPSPQILLLISQLSIIWLSYQPSMRKYPQYLMSKNLELMLHQVHLNLYFNQIILPLFGLKMQINMINNNNNNKFKDKISIKYQPNNKIKTQKM